MNKTHFDVIIIGGGCAGLSLALSLSAKEQHKTILIVESRREYVGDRTWCFWNVQNHPFEHLIEHRWPAWEVQWGGKNLSLTSSQYEYQCIPSEKFYHATTSQLKNNPKVTFLMNMKVIRLIENQLNVLVETSEGAFTSAIVYDSSQRASKTNLLQHFYGWKILSTQPVFNAQAATLMDFDVDQEAGLNFMYVLPFSDRCALIESTFISAQVQPKTVYEKALKTYLSRRYLIEDYEILSQEQGILPLQTSSNGKATQRIVPIGAHAGWARGSTGYAFLAIQTGVENLLDSKSPSHKKCVDNFLDQTFLSYLQEEPEKGPELFFNLFKKNAPDPLIRFLSSQWSYSDLVRVLMSMPKTAMIKQVLK